jgi:hypothetical protein
MGQYDEVFFFSKKSVTPNSKSGWSYDLDFINLEMSIINCWFFIGGVVNPPDLQVYWAGW